ncbi:MAG: Wzz/FepE/Etk N-terminal domain-containing protein, partial [Nitrospira sp.]
MNRNEGFAPLQSVPGDGPETVLAEYAGACRRRVWLITAIAAGVAGVAAVWSFLQTPQYQARATVVVEQVGPNGLQNDRDSRQSDLSPEYFQTQFELIKSHHVFQRTAQLLHLSEQPEYQPKPSILSSMVGGIMPTADADIVAQKEGADERLLKRFTEAVEIVPMRGARLAHV